MFPKKHLSTNQTCQSHLKNNLLILAAGANNKDHHANLIPIPSIKYPTSFVVNYKNDSNIMVARDGNIVCQQNSQEPETKKQNSHNHQTYNLIENKEAD